MHDVLLGRSLSVSSRSKDKVNDVMAFGKERSDRLHYIDATFGAGGYSKKILESAEYVVVYGFDRDYLAKTFADKLHNFDNRIHFVHSNFSTIKAFCKAQDLIGKISGVVFDLGVSSMQLSCPERGFSFINNGPLDMRMGESKNDFIDFSINHNQSNFNSTYRDAKDFVNNASVDLIFDVIKIYGEDSRARLISNAIVSERIKGSIDTTGHLASVVKNVYPAGYYERHPATKTFQAIRMYINNELHNLYWGLVSAASVLKSEGRIVVVSFHGLECRVIKNVFNILVNKERNLDKWDSMGLDSRYSFKYLVKKAMTPSAEEISQNRRSRSAKLRAIVKI